MIKYIEGNLLESEAQALVNTVNTVGVMGKGIALQFKNQFPNNFKAYKKACKDGEIAIGKLFVFEESNLLSGKKIIINFPTKTKWSAPSQYSYIEEGMKDLVRIIKKYKITSLAIPPLGSGNGGLDWNKVKYIMEHYLSGIDINIFIYQPNYIVKEVLRKERAKLTPARAMLLAILYDLVKNGEFVSEFASEKVAYFLQRFGAQKEFKLNYSPYIYGPYSGQVKHVLYFLNGSYITGYSSKDKKPFEELGIILDAEKDIEEYLLKPDNKKYNEIVVATKEFLKGAYSYYTLELLSTVDYIMDKMKVDNVDDIKEHLKEWSDRKTQFSEEKYLQLAYKKVSKIHPI